MARPERTDVRARHYLLSGDHSPLWGRGHRPAGVFWLSGEEILHKERRDFGRRQNRGVRKICRRRKTKVSRPLLFNRAERVLIVKRIGVLEECSEAERSQNDNLLIPLAHKGKSSDSSAG